MLFLPLLGRLFPAKSPPTPLRRPGASRGSRLPLFRSACQSRSQSIRCVDFQFLLQFPAAVLRRLAITHPSPLHVGCQPHFRLDGKSPRYTDFHILVHSCYPAMTRPFSRAPPATLSLDRRISLVRQFPISIRPSPLHVGRQPHFRLDGKLPRYADFHILVHNCYPAMTRLFSRVPPATLSISSVSLPEH